MAKYEEDDKVTFYFVIVEDGDMKRIQAWSDNKEIMNAYMDFHKCKNYTLRKFYGKMKEIWKITEENVYDEIQLMKLHTYDKDRKRIELIVPMTRTESQFLSDECLSFLQTFIDYSYLNDAIPFLKKKYQKALHGIFLNHIIQYVIHTQPSPLVQGVEFDQLMLLYHVLPDHFGK